MIKCVLSNQLKITGADQSYVEWLERFCTYNLEAFATEEDPNASLLSLFKKEGDDIYVPRGMLSVIQEHAKHNNQTVEVEYRCAVGDKYDFNVLPHINYTTGTFHYQGRVINELSQYNTVRLEAPAGSGKTCVACLFMALMKKGPVLFLTNRDKLIRQFVNTVEKVLGIPKEEVGLIKADKCIIKPITAGSLNTIGKDSFNLEQLKDIFPVVFFDECHISTAYTYRTVLLGLAPQHLIGLSATPDHYISIDLNNLMLGLLGPVAVKVDEKEIPGRLTPRVLRKDTHKTYDFKARDSSPDWMKFKCRNKMQNDLAADPDRNAMVVQDCSTLIKRGYKVLIVTARVQHGYILHKLLIEAGVRSSFPYKYSKKDDDSKDEQKVDHKELDRASTAVEEGEVDALIGTINLFKEGFDCRPLSAILFAAPFSGVNSTTIIQSIGRIQRHYFNKEDAIVIDYADKSYPNNVLEKWANDRSKTLITLYGLENYDHLK